MSKIASASFTLKLITTPHYHLWNDTLHIRALAKQTEDPWVRGTYVRIAVILCWVVLEMCCREALEDDKIGYSFKKDLDRAIDNKGLAKNDWGTGIWQKVLELRDRRKKYVHVNISQSELFADIEIADDAINVVRNAVKAVYTLVNVDIPSWIDDNNSEGWTG